MWKTASLMLLAIVVMPATALAQGSPSGIYAEARGGAVFLMDSDLDTGIPGLDAELSFDPGWMAEGAIGYADSSGLRGEVALGYRKNDFDEVKVSGLGSASVNGDITATTIMANGYYDIYFDSENRWAFYLGGGIGAAYLDVSGDLGSDDDTVFAYQGSAGFSFAATPSIVLSLGYQYFATEDPKFGGTDAEYRSNNAIAGARFMF